MTIDIFRIDESRKAGGPVDSGNSMTKHIFFMEIFPFYHMCTHPITNK